MRVCARATRTCIPRAQTYAHINTCLCVRMCTKHTRMHIPHTQDYDGPLARDWSNVFGRGSGSIISRENECKAARALAMRLRQELLAYPTSIEEDANLIQETRRRVETHENGSSGKDLSAHSAGSGFDHADARARAESLALALQLRLSKKLLLQQAAAYIEQLASMDNSSEWSLPYVWELCRDGLGLLLSSLSCSSCCHENKQTLIAIVTVTVKCFSGCRSREC